MGGNVRNRTPGKGMTMSIDANFTKDIPVDADFPDDIKVIRWDEERLYVHPGILEETERELEELRHLLAEAIDTIKIFHGNQAWDIYYENAPEMLRLRAAVETEEWKAAKAILEKSG